MLAIMLYGGLQAQQVDFSEPVLVHDGTIYVENLKYSTGDSNVISSTLMSAQVSFEKRYDESNNGTITETIWHPTWTNVPSNYGRNSGGYYTGTVVELQFNPNPGYRFLHVVDGNGLMIDGSDMWGTTVYLALLENTVWEPIFIEMTK